MLDNINMAELNSSMLKGEIINNVIHPVLEIISAKARAYPSHIQ